MVFDWNYDTFGLKLTCRLQIWLTNLHTWFNIFLSSKTSWPSNCISSLNWFANLGFHFEILKLDTEIQNLFFKSIFRFSAINWLAYIGIQFENSKRYSGVQNLSFKSIYMFLDRTCYISNLKLSGKPRIWLFKVKNRLRN